MDLLGTTRRTKMCGEFRASDIGQEVVAQGFVAKERNLGPIIFVDLRDRTGIVQISFESAVLGSEAFAKATSIRNEFVLSVKGEVRSRGEKNINKNIPTGEIEISVKELKILSVAEVPPFVVGDTNVSEALRLKYRYLDLRRSYVQDRIVFRSRLSKIIRDYMDENNFLEIETPILGRSTPEGARDYLVPSRVHQGEFYALPQSPQQYKQILMISGFDRYYQIARCFRDEDLRANRQPEFTQVDMEMSFADTEDIMAICEGLMRKVFKETIGYDIGNTIPKMPYREAMDKYGSDKPDVRFAMEINDISSVVSGCEFPVFADACKTGSVRAINAKGIVGQFTRKEIDKLTLFLKENFGAKGLAYMLHKPEGTTCSFAKFMKPEELDAINKALNAETGDAVFIVADAKNSVVLSSLGALRLKIAKEHNLIPDGYKILWVTEFPLVAYSEEEGRYVAEHHPFTAPMDEDIPLMETNPLAVRSKAYDLVINGEEAGGGSVRIHSTDLQCKMFNLLGMSDETIKERFGYFVDAFRYGTPPHCGLAFGLDRLVMLLTKTDSIKDVIAFPKVQNASCLMTDAPSVVDDKQLKDLGLK